jgi:hypothetical protein
VDPLPRDTRIEGKVARGLAIPCVIAVAVAVSGCGGGQNDTSATRSTQANVPARQRQPPKPQPISAHIIQSYNARLVSIQVVHVHWRLARPAVLSLNVAGAHRDGSTRGGASGVFPLPPSDFAHGRPASAGSGHAHLNFEFGDYDFNDSPEVQFRLVAISGRMRDRSQPITLARKPSG